MRKFFLCSLLSALTLTTAFADEMSYLAVKAGLARSSAMLAQSNSETGMTCYYLGVVSAEAREVMMMAADLPAGNPSRAAAFAASHKAVSLADFCGFKPNSDYEPKISAGDRAAVNKVLDEIIAKLGSIR